MGTPTQSPLPGSRPLTTIAGGGLRNPALSPLPPRGPKPGRRWAVWLVLIPVLLLGLVYVLGRTVDAVRLRLMDIPLAGKLLFGDPVWPILWNKSEAQTPGAAPETPSDKPGAQPAPAPVPQPLADLEAQIAARLAAVEVREKELRQQEAALKEREDALRAKEADVAQQEVRLSQSIKANDQLTLELEGQIRSEKAQVEVLRSMRSSARAQAFAAMDDAEAIRYLKHMDAEEVADVLATMDPYRQVRILVNLREVAPSANTP